MISCYDEDKNRVIIGLNDGSLVWYDLEGERVVYEIPHLHAFAINKLLIWDQNLFSASVDGVVIRTDKTNLSKSEPIFDWKRCSWEHADFWGSKSRYSIYWLRKKHDTTIQALRPCRGTSRLMLPGYAGTCFIVDYETKALEVLCHIDKEKDLLGKAHYDTVFDCDYDPATQLIATSGGAGHAAILLWNNRNYEFVGQYSRHEEYLGHMYAVRFLGDEILVSGCEKDTILIWDNKGYRGSISPGMGKVFSIDASVHGEWFVVGGKQGKIRTYSSSTFAPICDACFELHEMFWVTISESGENVVASFVNGDIAVLKVSESGQLSPYFGPCGVPMRIERESSRDYEIKPFLNE